MHTSSATGNNAVEMETTATFDKQADEFIINTPSTVAQKYWITNSAVHAKWSAVFAQLLIDGKNHGIHGFLVRIRNEVYAPSCLVQLLLLLPLKNYLQMAVTADRVAASAGQSLLKGCAITGVWYKPVQTLAQHEAQAVANLVHLLRIMPPALSVPLFWLSTLHANHASRNMRNKNLTCPASLAVCCLMCTC